MTGTISAVWPLVSSGKGVSQVSCGLSHLVMPDVLELCTVAYWCQQAALPIFVQVACMAVHVTLHWSVETLFCDNHVCTSVASPTGPVGPQSGRLFDNI